MSDHDFLFLVDDNCVRYGSEGKYSFIRLALT